MPTDHPGNDAFTQAVYAVIDGKREILTELLEQNPALCNRRSSSPHKATLLHYLAANGVEDGLQRTPSNAVEIGQILIEAGAEVDATAEMYDGGPYQTPLNNLVSSWWPCKAGVQSALVSLLVDAGANPNGLLEDGAPLGLALGFGYTEAAEMLASKGADYHNLVYAAGLGKIEVVRTFLDEDGQLSPEASNFKVSDKAEVGRFSWPPPKNKDPKHIAFVYACLHGRTGVVKLLLEKGVQVNTGISYGQTGLHYAAYGGHLDTIKLLLASGADPDLIETQFNKTAVEWAVESNEIKAICLLNQHVMPENKKQLSHGAPVFPVTDVKQTAEYYRDKLGFEIKFLWEEPPTYAVLKRQGVGIHLSKKEDDFRPSKNHVAYYIFAYDVDGLFHEFKDKGVEILSEPIERDYGMKDFDIRDINGYILSFGCGN